MPNRTIPPPQAARNMVYALVSERLHSEDAFGDFSPDQVMVVWFCFILGNWKALVTTTLGDGMYYEVTFNGEKEEIYIDTYEKASNQVFDYQPLPED